jgi:hypothetical protein
MSDIDLGPPVLVWRDDPLFNQGHVAAELALAILRKLEERLDINADDEADIVHAIERLEVFLSAATEEARKRAATERGIAEHAAYDRRRYQPGSFKD